MKTLPQTILGLCEEREAQTALRRKKGGVYASICWAELGEEIRRYGRSLLRHGIAPGDRVAIMAPNSPEWVYADLGAMSVGALTVPVYHTEGIDTLLHILADSESRILFLHSARSASKLMAVREKIPSLETLVLLQGHLDSPGVLALPEFLAGGEQISSAAFDRAVREGDPEKTCTIVYTSGTTGTPKGVCLSHRNILANIEECSALFPIGPGDECLSFLPLSHVFERVDGYYFMLRQGVTIAYAESPESVPQNLSEVRPTVMISVPRLYEKMHSRVMEAVLNGPKLKKFLFFAALKAGSAHAAQETAGRRSGLPLRLAVALGRRVVFSKLRERLGGRLRFFISGGAPLAKNVSDFFDASGIPIFEGYGLTETAGGISVNSPGQRRPGTVGRPFSNLEVRIAPDGEILLQGRGIFSGYWNRPEETREAFDGGWFRTGDVGSVDADGFLSITDRKKDLLITASGENIAPQPLENLFKTEPLIANALVFGDRKPYLTALLVPDMTKLEAFARETGIPFDNHCDLVTQTKVLEQIRQRIDKLQEGLPSFHRVKRFTLLSQDFSGQELTPTLKLRRKVISTRFAGVLEGMYEAGDHGIHDSGLCIVETLTEAERN